MTKHTHKPIAGALWMILAGTCFAIINTTNQYLRLTQYRYWFFSIFHFIYGYVALGYKFRTDYGIEN